MIVSEQFAISVIVRKLAIDAVKRELRSRGTRITQWPSVAELHRMAREYLHTNQAELIAQAREKWRQWDGLGKRNGVASRKTVSASGA